MRKMILTVVLFTVAAAVHAADEATAPAPTPQSSNTYTVVDRDTLWDLAGKFYRNSYTWPKLWEANKSAINDPNQIYPGQILAVPDSIETIPVAAAPAASAENSAPAVSPQPVMKAESTASTEETPIEENIVPAVPQQEAMAEQPPTPEVKLAAADKIYFNADSFIAPKNWRTDGEIIGDKDKKIMLAEGDIVYVNLGARQVDPGVRCNIYRKFGKVKDPDTGDVLGYEVHLVGSLTITEGVGSDAVTTARVANSREPIEIGDRVEIVK